MDKKTNTIKYYTKTKSERIMETGELLELISSAKSGISKKSLKNFTGNYLRNDFKTLLTNNLVKEKKTSALSKREENIYCTNKKFSLNYIKEMELLSYAVWYLRELGLKIGKVSITENGNIIASAALLNSEEDYVLLELSALSLRNYSRKLSNIKSSKEVQSVLVVEDNNVFKRLRESDIQNRVVIFKSIQGKNMFLAGNFNGESIEEDFNFRQLKRYKDKSEVEKILDGYRKCELLREKSWFKKYNEDKKLGKEMEKNGF